MSESSANNASNFSQRCFPFCKRRWLSSLAFRFEFASPLPRRENSLSWNDKRIKLSTPTELGIPFFFSITSAGRDGRERSGLAMEKSKLINANQRRRNYGKNEPLGLWNSRNEFTTNTNTRGYNELMHRENGERKWLNIRRKINLRCCFLLMFSHRFRFRPKFNYQIL